MLSACGKNEDVSSSTAEPENPVALSAPSESGVVFSKVTLGHTLDDQKRVVDANTTFGSKDSVYVSVETTGTGKSEIKVKYNQLNTPNADQIEETTQKIDATGTAVTEFQIYHNGGWEPGIYTVEVSIDGKPVATKEFTVQ
ncbi:MAG TPA: hypothetical protein VK974_02395 [Methylophilaceae bacterium]|nr:hypothetical protein [Methylophilaceae bacterium]